MKLEWSWTTLALYITLALVTALLFRQSVIDKKKDKKIRIFGLCIKTKYIYYLVIYLLFILFACFKYMGEELVGVDTLTYIGYFENLNYVHLNIKETLLLNSYEYLFYNTMYIVNILGGTYRVFLFIVNSAMIASLIYFVDKEISEESSCLWLVLAYLPLLRSLNIIRNCIAAFIGFVSISLLRQNKIRYSIIFAVIAYLNHYIALILFALIAFYKIFPKRILMDRIKMSICILAVTFMSVALVPIAKEIMLNTGYSHYAAKIQVSLFGYIPYIFVCLFTVLNRDFYDYLEKRGHSQYYIVISFLTLVLPFFIAINAASRVLLFFELPVILVASDIADYLKKYIPEKHAKLYNAFVVIVILAYYVFKIWRMWESNGIMPYYNILFMK